MRYLKRQRPANLHTIAHRPPTWHHIRHARKCEHSAGELVFGDEARGRRPRSSRLSRRNNGVAGRGRDRTSGGHAGGRRREHHQPRVLLAAVQRPTPPRSGTPPKMIRAWEAAWHAWCANRPVRIPCSTLPRRRPHLHFTGLEPRPRT